MPYIIVLYRACSLVFKKNFKDSSKDEDGLMMIEYVDIEDMS